MPTSSPFDPTPFVVVDVETTGGSPHGGDRVTEVAAVLVYGGEVTPVFQSLVNPERSIPWFITNLTGISDAMVRTAPTFADIAGEFAQHLAGRVFVAHNARFDWGFLSAEFARVTPTPLDAIADGQLCTVRLARRFLGHLHRRNLDAVSHHYGVTIESRHRAMGDALATAHVLRGLLRDAELRGIDDVAGLTAQLRKKTSRSAMPRFSSGAEGA